MIKIFLLILSIMGIIICNIIFTSYMKICYV